MSKSMHFDEITTAKSRAVNNEQPISNAKHSIVHWMVRSQLRRIVIDKSVACQGKSGIWMELFGIFGCFFCEFSENYTEIFKTL